MSNRNALLGQNSVAVLWGQHIEWLIFIVANQTFVAENIPILIEMIKSVSYFKLLPNFDAIDKFSASWTTRV